MKDIVQPYFVDRAVDVVYHLASPASPIDYLRLPLHTLKVGSHGTHHTLGLAKKHRARFLLASTSEVYGDPQVHPQKETYWGHVNPIGPRGVYDEAKRYAEALTMAYHRQQGVDTAIIRIFNSVLADEQVLYDDGRELAASPLRELASRLARRSRRAYAATRRDRHVGDRRSGDGGRVSARRLQRPRVRRRWTCRRCTDHIVRSRIRPRSAASRCGQATAVRSASPVTTRSSSRGPMASREARPVVDLDVGDRVAIARRIEVPERDVAHDRHARRLAPSRAGSLGSARRGSWARRARLGAATGSLRAARLAATQRRPELAQRGVDEAHPDARDRSGTAAGPAAHRRSAFRTARSCAFARSAAASRCRLACTSPTTSSGCLGCGSPRGRGTSPPVTRS